jgi:hypothetical protein
MNCPRPQNGENYSATGGTISFTCHSSFHYNKNSRNQLLTDWQQLILSLSFEFKGGRASWRREQHFNL